MYTLDLHSLRFYQRALRSLMSPLHSRLVSWSLSPQGKGMSIPNPCTSYRDLVWRTCINSVYGLHTGYFLTLCWSPIRGGDLWYYGWVTLAPGHYFSTNVCLAVQAWGTSSVWCHLLRPLIQWVQLATGFYLSLASTFPAHVCPPNSLLCFSYAMALTWISF